MPRAGQMNISGPIPSPTRSEGGYDAVPISPSRPYGAIGLGSPGRRERGQVGANGGREPSGRGYHPAGPVEMDYSASPTHDYLESFTRPNLPYNSTQIPTSPSGGSDVFGSSPNLSHSPSEKFLGETRQYNSSRLLKTEYPRNSDMGVEYDAYKARYKEPRGCVPSNPTKRRWLFWGVPIGLVIAAGIAVGVAVAVTKSNGNKTSGGSSNGSGSDGNGSGTGTGGTGNDAGNNNFGVAASGTDGSTVTMDDGTSFVYSNSFGGSWAVNPYDPYSVSGQAQEFTPSLLQEWQWGSDQIRGVNLGGWLVTEPFIVPALYERYQNSTPQAVDEWTLSQAMGADLATAMEEHYKTFITEQDFADIAAAGLNWLRIPLGYWAIETMEDEAYLGKVSWTYFLKAIEWARKYGLRILLDFHALPGSQNGWNHSGHAGVVNWLYGVMGVTNAQRSLEQIRSLVQFISQDGIKQVVPMIGLVNEVQSSVVGHEILGSFYYEAYQMVRSMGGYGAGNGPILAIHEGFEGIAAWNGFLLGADRVALDQHPYLAFQATQNNNPYSVNAAQACGWGGGTNDSSTQFGITIGGEWSLAINNCGKWLNGVGSTPSYEGQGQGSCLPWEDWRTFTQDRKDGMAQYALSSMDALQNWFFWTWRIGNSTERGYAPSPMWHYQLGLQQGWLPQDPRTAGGYCKDVMNVGGNQFAGTYPASAIGGVASPSIAAAQTASYGIWPPQSLGPSPTFSANQVALFPTLTQTGTPIVLPTATHPSNVTVGNGWAFASDTAQAYVRVNGCPYPDQYNATDAALAPTALCTGTPAKREFVSRITAAPRV